MYAIRSYYVPLEGEGGRVGRVICDIHTPDNEPFAGCPRLALKRQIAGAADLGYTMMAGCEVEFFLFERDASGIPSTATHDSGSYFDLTPVDKGEELRRLMVHDLELMSYNFV